MDSCREAVFSPGALLIFQYTCYTSLRRLTWNVCMQDLWTHTENGTAIRNFTAKAVPAHGVVALLLKDAGDEPAGTMPPCSTLEWCTGEDGTLINP